MSALGQISLVPGEAEKACFRAHSGSANWLGPRSIWRPGRPINRNIEGEQAIEQFGLAIEMPLRETRTRHLFCSVLEKPKPKQRPQDARLHGEVRRVPAHCQHVRLRDCAKARKFFAGVPVAGRNRERPQNNANMGLWPRAKQAATKKRKIHVPECQRRRKIRPRGGAKVDHSGVWSVVPGRGTAASQPRPQEAGG